MPTQQPPGNWKSRWAKGGRLRWGWCPAPARAAELLPPAREQGRQSEAGDGVSGTRRCESGCFWLHRTGVRDAAVAMPFTCLMSPGPAG